MREMNQSKILSLEIMQLKCSSVSTSQSSRIYPLMGVSIRQMLGVAIRCNKYDKFYFLFSDFSRDVLLILRRERIFLSYPMYFFIIQVLQLSTRVYFIE